jgi:hypothetical protein
VAENTPDPTQDALFREVDDDLRHEQMTRLWKAYGGWLVGAAVLVVAVVAGYQGWQAWQANLRRAEARAFEQATADAAAAPGQAAEALAAMAADARTGYRALARLDQAALLAEAGRPAEAMAVWRAVADDTGADPVARDLARILWALTALDVPSTDPAEATSTVADLAAPGSPFQASALEVQALAALQTGDVDGARRMFQDIGALTSAPRGPRDRAAEMLATLGPDDPAASEPPADGPAVVPESPQAAPPQAPPQAPQGQE